MPFYPSAAVIAIAFSAHGYRKGSLSTSGALAALIVGYVGLARQIKVFGVLLLLFYLIGSRATKFKSAYKASLEQGNEVQTKTASGGLAGNRDAAQVLCNSWLPTLCSMYWDSPSSQTTALPYCPLSSTSADMSYPPIILAITTFFYAACLGDTLSSELGILSTGRPRLITNGKAVARGTNGGVSPFGLLCSLVGGLIIGLIALTSFWVERDASCVENDVLAGVKFLGAASLAGLTGSLLDSLLGATMQATYYNTIDKKVLAHPKNALRSKNVKIIAGRDILSNNGVNLVSSTATALLGAWLYA